ncbi:MAG: hypothetical protein K1Y36_06595 [Blastocatellia bacterium]|nr:hypothetical protein [Blastocatellia bacterium]
MVRIMRFVSLCLPLAFLISCGGSQPPSRWEKVQQDTTNPQKQEINKPIVPPKAGGTLNDFFPKSADGYDVTPSQEKAGFAEYKLKKGGKEMAMLAISDATAGNPAAMEKFKQSSKSIGGFPAVEQGSTATALLVNGRYQVKVLSRSPEFTPADRAAWLQKFDLTGLAALK